MFGRRKRWGSLLRKSTGLSADCPSPRKAYLVETARALRNSVHCLQVTNTCIRSPSVRIPPGSRRIETHPHDCVLTSQPRSRRAPLVCRSGPCMRAYSVEAVRRDACVGQTKNESWGTEETSGKRPVVRLKKPKRSGYTVHSARNVQRKARGDESGRFVRLARRTGATADDAVVAWVRDDSGGIQASAEHRIHQRGRGYRQAIGKLLGSYWVGYWEVVSHVLLSGDPAQNACMVPSLKRLDVLVNHGMPTASSSRCKLSAPPNDTCIPVRGLPGAASPAWLGFPGSPGCNAGGRVMLADRGDRPGKALVCAGQEERP
eukprot:1195630-Prorocentrum_minimum.AAC.4